MEYMEGNWLEPGLKIVIIMLNLMEKHHSQTICDPYQEINDESILFWIFTNKIAITGGSINRHQLLTTRAFEDRLFNIFSFPIDKPAIPPEFASVSFPPVPDPDAREYQGHQSKPTATASGPGFPQVSRSASSSQSNIRQPG